MKPKKIRYKITLLVIILLWLGMGFCDFLALNRFELPVFSVCTKSYDDGGSGTYRGLGYRFEIEGNFMPEDEFPGVTRYDYYIFGIHVKESIRD